MHPGALLGVGQVLAQPLDLGASFVSLNCCRVGSSSTYKRGVVELYLRAAEVGFGLPEVRNTARESPLARKPDTGDVSASLVALPGDIRQLAQRGLQPIAQPLDFG